MGHLTLGREMYYFEDQHKQKIIPDDAVLLADLERVLNSRDCFIISSRSFDLLEKLGFKETYNDEENSNQIIAKILDSKRLSKYFLDFSCAFEKVDGDTITELYFERYDYDTDDRSHYFYRIGIKGSYLKSSLPDDVEKSVLNTIKYPKTKNPVIIVFAVDGSIVHSCTSKKDTCIWYFENSDHYNDGIYKEYESKKIFDVAIVNYTNKRKIESVIFRMGDRHIDLSILADVVPEFVQLKPSEQLNWEHYITPEQLLVLEMNHI